MAESRPVASMTGFARSEGSDELSGWVWEIKSVNGRSLDVRCRLPGGYEGLDPVVRGAVAQHCSRGNLQVGLSLLRTQRRTRLRVNQELLAQLTEVARELGGLVDAAPPRLDGLMALPGVVELEEPVETEAQRAAREAALRATLEIALELLARARRSEGERLRDLASGHVAALGGLVEAATACDGAQPAAIKERLQRQLAELLEPGQGLSEDRLAQEVALLATKADVREELDRLRAHLEAARAMLAEGGPIGRRLDFLCQELNREANTVCSKSADLALTQIGLQLKSTIDQLREQIQNIE